MWKKLLFTKSEGLKHFHECYQCNWPIANFTQIGAWNTTETNSQVPACYRSGKNVWNKIEMS